MREPLRLLRELGWIEGQNLHVEHRYASSIELLQPLAEELVREGRGHPRKWSEPDASGDACNYEHSDRLPCGE